MEIKSATYLISNSDYRKCPDTGLPEYAFIGRSNVGKSSLINMLTNNKSLAKTSVKPGKTQLINHFLINQEWYLVDLPGYGYARTSKVARSGWRKMVADYFLHRETLVSTFVLIDSRISPQPIDLEFLAFLGRNRVPLSIIFTKIDKLRQRDLAANVALFKQTLTREWESLPTCFLSSAVTGYGRDNILTYIETINQSLTS